MLLSVIGFGCSSSSTEEEITEEPEQPEEPAPDTAGHRTGTAGDPAAQVNIPAAHRSVNARSRQHRA